MVIVYILKVELGRVRDREGGLSLWIVKKGQYNSKPNPNGIKSKWLFGMKTVLFWDKILNLVKIHEIIGT